MEQLLIYICLLIITTIACFIYYKTIKKAQLEYESSKDLIKAITLDFSYKFQKISKEISKLLIAFEDLNKIIYSTKLVIEEDKKNVFNMKEEFCEFRNKVIEMEKEINKLKIDFEKIQKSGLQLPNNVNLDSLIEVDVFKNLTDTEVEVLSIIEEIGEASVSDIKKRINKTREHTARLLKKLYDKGYIDRNSNRMPYKYYIRKELKDKIKTRQKVEAIT